MPPHRKSLKRNKIDREFIMNLQARANDAVKRYIYQRTDRVMINDEGYFYRTREGEIMGPFATESETLFDLNIFKQVTMLEQELNDENYLDIAC